MSCVCGTKHMEKRIWKARVAVLDQGGFRQGKRKGLFFSVDRRMMLADEPSWSVWRETAVKEEKHFSSHFSITNLRMHYVVQINSNVKLGVLSKVLQVFSCKSMLYFQLWFY